MTDELTPSVQGWSLSPMALGFDARDLVSRYGNNSNVFLTLYDGYRYFHPASSRTEGMMAYVETRHAWIGATEPVAPVAEHAALLSEFAHAARTRKRVAMCLPVGAETVERARPLGYDGLKIGSEPWFRLSNYNPSLDRLTIAKRLASRGATVREVSLLSLSSQLKGSLDGLTREWLDSRKMATLHFLNRVEPWTLGSWKKYFVVEWQGRSLAFLAAVPIPARGGWYFVDLIRSPSSPPGSTELLMLESLRLLKEQGASLVSLGVAPLSDLDVNPDPNHPLVSRLCAVAYEHWNLFYNFKTLHQFKLKFEPSYWESAYLLYSPPRMGVKSTVALLDAFVGKSISGALWSGVERKAARFRVRRWLEGFLSANVVMRPPAPTLARAFGRLPLTSALLCIHVLFFILTAPSLARDGGIFLMQNAYSPRTLLEGDWSTVLLSPLLHWSWLHLLINEVTLFLFAGGLESLAGTFFLAVCYAGAALLSNALTTTLVLLPLAAWLGPLTDARDVGASVGIFGAMGALTWLFRHGKMALGIAALAILGYVAGMRDFFALNHLFSLGIGAGLGYRLLHRPR